MTLALGVGLPLANTILAACAPLSSTPTTASKMTSNKIVFGTGADITNMDPHGDIFGVDESMFRNY